VVKIKTSPPQNLLYHIVKQQFPEAQLNYRVFIWQKGKYRYIDVALPSIKLAIEYDGLRYHNKAKDDTRDLELLTIGWTVIHVNKYTFKDFVAQLPLIIKERRELYEATVKQRGSVNDTNTT
jgi:very-short-patch-repair endonuclease